MYHHRAKLDIAPTHASRRISLDTDIYWSQDMEDLVKHEDPADFLKGTALEDIDKLHDVYGLEHNLARCAGAAAGLLNDDDLLALAEAATLRKPAAFLNAHRGGGRKQWCYEDNGAHSIQRWINQQQGDHGIILIGVCNPYAKNIKSSVPVIHASTNYRPAGALSDLAHSFGCTDVFIPGRGYVDSYEYAACARELAAKNNSDKQK